MDVQYLYQFHTLLNNLKNNTLDEDGNVIEMTERKEPKKSQRQLFYLKLKNKKKNKKKN